MHPDTVTDTGIDPAIENAAREILSTVLDPEVAPQELDLDADLVGSYSLTSLNKVLFLTEVCEATDVDLANFTEHDLADMLTLRSVIESLTRHTNNKAV
ncbi:acyl carrier protein [Streptomyces sp. NBC_01264]|uniref:acyl carrier protein n=1 Tax=Streptomyces sp. NBC_01264 TaxID=2903804 RepID=UPI00224D11A5|nr:acyl carrier protein [Streptomyces sp. NBC_01264]MCX4783113.1 acyl carrier protein [Streptomyces sp. NBC_01264]